MNLDIFSDQIDISPGSDPTVNSKPLETINNQVSASLLPPLPSQNRVKQNPSNTDNSCVKTIQIQPSGQLHSDNSKRISDLIHFPVPNLGDSQINESGDEDKYQQSDNHMENNNENQNYHEPVINNKYKKTSFSKLNLEQSKNNGSFNSSSSDNKNLNTYEPTALYLNASCDESSPTDLTPKNDVSSNGCKAELIIDNGFVVHDPPIQTNTNKNSARLQKKEKNVQSVQKRSENKDSLKEEARNAMNRFLNNNEIPPDHLQPLIIGLIRSEIITATMEEDYNRACELENASNLLSTAIEWRTSEIRRNAAKETIHGRFEQVKRNYESETGEWKKIFSVFKDQQIESQKKLEQAHNEEKRAFEEKWSTNANMIKYNKPSPTLIQLRKLQKNLAISHQFEEAKRVKLTADLQQIKESEEAKKRAEETMINEYDALIEKQKREKQCFYDHQKTTELFLKNQRCRVLQPLEMQMKQLKTTINRDKPTNLKPQKYTFQSTAKTKIAAAELNPASPRIVTKYARYKKNEEAQKLTINGLDVRKIIRKKRGSSVQTRRVFI